MKENFAAQEQSCTDREGMNDSKTTKSQTRAWKTLTLFLSLSTHTHTALEPGVYFL